MPFTARDLLLGFGLPALIAWLTIALAAAMRFGERRFLAASLGSVAGYLAGYWSLDLGPYVPQVERDWLAYAPAFGAVAGLGLLLADRSKLAAAGTSLLAIAAIAWLLSPTWKSLTTPRVARAALWAIYAAGLAGCSMATVPRRQSSRPFPTDERKSGEAAWARPWGESLWCGMAALTLGAAAGLLALSGSLRFGQIAACLGATYLGAAVAIAPGRRGWDFRAFAALYAVAIAAFMLTGQMNSFSPIPRFCYYLLPIAPAASGAIWRAMASSNVPSRAAVSLLAGGAVLAVALGIAVAMQPPPDPEW
ncbi:MAG: hypothetical protein KDA61_05160, partial [Planctomycetales bacterium]|nr:hypothetical protein [Planctomycetales bacterium]